MNEQDRTEQTGPEHTERNIQKKLTKLKRMSIVLWKASRADAHTSTRPRR